MGKVERRSRPDRATANVVKVGLILAERDGRHAAAAFMDRSGVPFRVIVRVLSDPTRQRRHQRWRGSLNDRIYSFCSGV